MGATVPDCTLEITKVLGFTSRTLWNYCFRDISLIVPILIRPRGMSLKNCEASVIIAVSINMTTEPPNVHMMIDLGQEQGAKLGNLGEVHQRRVLHMAKWEYNTVKVVWVDNQMGAAILRSKRR